MQKSEVLTKILEDFTNNDPALASDAVQAFCDYANTWLATHGVIGVGQTASGISLRFSDGEELILFSSVFDTPIEVQGVSQGITGNATKIEKGMPVASPSFPITGR